MEHFMNSRNDFRQGRRQEKKLQSSFSIVFCAMLQAVRV
jgi:hypothetical protein